MSASRPTVRALYQSLSLAGQGVAAALIVPLVAVCAWSVGYDPMVAAAGSLALLVLAHLWLTRPAAVASWLVLAAAVTMSPVVAAGALTLHGSGSLSLLTAAVALGAALLTLTVTARAGQARARRVAFALAVYLLTVLAVAPLTASWSMLAALLCAAAADAALPAGRRRAAVRNAASLTGSALAEIPRPARTFHPRRMRGATPAPEAVLLAPGGVFVLASVEAYAAAVTTDPVTVDGIDQSDTLTVLDRQCRATARALRVGDRDPVAVLVVHRSALAAPAWSTTRSGRPLLLVPGSALAATITALPDVATSSALATLARRLTRASVPLPW